VVEREILRLVRSLMFRYGKGVKRVLIIGTSDATGDIALSLANTAKSGYEIVAVAGPKKIMPDQLSAHHYSLVETALKDIQVNGINTIIQTDLYDSVERNQRILSMAQTHHIEYSFIPGEAEFYSGKNSVDVFLGYPMITVYQNAISGLGRHRQTNFRPVTEHSADYRTLSRFLASVYHQEGRRPRSSFLRQSTSQSFFKTDWTDQISQHGCQIWQP